MSKTAFKKLGYFFMVLLMFGCSVYAATANGGWDWSAFIVLNILTVIMAISPLGKYLPAKEGDTLFDLYYSPDYYWWRGNHYYKHLRKS